MTLHKRRTSLTAGGLTLALVLAACGGTDNGADDLGQGQQDEARPGGVVKILNQSDFEHLDPQRNYVSNSQNAGRLITRTLMIVKEEPGEEPELLGDLAESWENSEDNQSWTFTLKDGLKYEDGTAVTAADVKYGVERSFSPDLPEGAPYARLYLAGSADYQGPYVGDNNGGSGLASIEAPDDKTIVFRLNQPVSDFHWAAAMPTFSPVPQAQDTKTLYDNDVVSTGPYKIEEYIRGQKLVLVRNEHWDPATDEVRQAHPDSFEFAFGQDAAVVDERLIADGAEDHNAMSQDVTVQNASLNRLQDPNVEPRVVRGPTICVRFLAMNMTKPAMQNPEVRKAIQYAVNKTDFQTAYGGDLFGPVVDSVIPEAVSGYKPVSLYEAPDTGDPEKAKKMLADAGVTDLSLTLASSDTARTSAASQALQAALARAGIEVTIQTLSGDNYYTVVLNDAEAPELMHGGWCGDWPSASSILPPVFGPDNLNKPTTHGENNLSRYTDAESWAEMKRIQTEISDPEEAAEAWADLNIEIMEDAPLVPMTNDGGVYVTGSKVGTGGVTPTLGGEIDLLEVWVKQ